MKYARSEHSSFHDSLLKSGRPEENMEAYNINATISIKLLPASLDNLNFGNAFNETFAGISFVLWNHFYLYYRCLFYNLRLYIWLGIVLLIFRMNYWLWFLMLCKTVLCSWIKICGAQLFLALNCTESSFRESIAPNITMAPNDLVLW